jgi:hypothetical protein
MQNSRKWIPIGKRARCRRERAPRQRIGKYLIVAQVALASTLLSAGALLLGAFVHMRSMPPGFQPQHVFALQVTWKGTPTRPPEMTYSPIGGLSGIQNFAAFTEGI